MIRLAFILLLSSLPWQARAEGLAQALSRCAAQRVEAEAETLRQRQALEAEAGRLEDSTLAWWDMGGRQRRGGALRRLREARARLERAEAALALAQTRELAQGDALRQAWQSRGLDAEEARALESWDRERLRGLQALAERRPGLARAQARQELAHWQRRSRVGPAPQEAKEGLRSLEALAR